MSAADRNHLNPILQRVALLQLAIAFIWLMFIGYLQFHGADNLQPAWALLALYLPLLVFTQSQLTRKSIRDWQLFVFLTIECQLFTGLLFFTGGATNPLISYFLVLIVIAAWGLPWNQSIWIAALGILDYSILAVWYQPILLSELDGMSHVQDMDHMSLASWHLSGMWLTFVISALILVTLIPQLMRTRQRQQQEIQQLREQQLKNEQLIGIGTLAAGTAHEMGTPLMTMGMVLEDLLDGDSVSQNPVLEKDLDLLLQQVQRCQQSLQQLAKQGREARTARVQPAHEWLYSNLQRWQLSHPKARFESAANMSQNSAPIQTSPLLDQALLNLLDNAAEAGSDTVQLSCQTTDGFWCLDICQNDPDAAHQLSQYVPYQSDKQSGLGIGLYLSNASVEQFGGSIELHALDNGGSLCKLRLPVHANASNNTTTSNTTSSNNTAATPPDSGANR